MDSPGSWFVRFVQRPLKMPSLTPQPSDSAVAAELAQIAERLAALASESQPSTMAAELGSIRAQLRQLAADNAEVGARLSTALGIQPPEH
jgi:hypothetical protein